MYIALLASALLVGALLAVQASANLQLNRAVGTPYGASTLQLTVAAVLLAVLAAVVGGLGALHALPDVTWWHLLGGLASPLYITSGILLFPRLGALTAVGLFVTGQMFASLALDLGGIIGVKQVPLNLGIVLGAVAVLVGITLIVRGQLAAQKGGPGTAVAADTKPAVAQGGWIVLGIIAGGVLPFQGAINAQLRADLHAPITAAMLSFIVAVVAITIVLLVLRATNRTPAPKFAPLKQMPWWGWLGGACAAAYVTVTFLLIPVIGAATTVAFTVTGQQVASAVIDQNGFFRLPKRKLTGPRVGGVVLLVLGSFLVQLAR
ncbi:DMT family transporter [Solihabitans fulvus]|uniref:DMT family transporter n=1 Tax=Solihabitans fulvus TaxID=1892852 RepID=A0A5B2X683_9PSEU|nr:DMT family transporter [Solihabitans fulvus]KAA2258716.1 DMT family transporter [Solihabitans fulvus]